MFVETYYDERVVGPGSANESVIPYPELSGEELIVWRKYLPRRRPVENPQSSFYIETIPLPVMREIERAQKTPRLFDHVEVWSRTADLMAVGVIGRQNSRYFTIARWGDAQLRRFPPASI